MIPFSYLKDEVLLINSDFKTMTVNEIRSENLQDDESLKWYTTQKSQWFPDLKRALLQEIEDCSPHTVWQQKAVSCLNDFFSKNRDKINNILEDVFSQEDDILEFWGYGTERIDMKS